MKTIMINCMLTVIFLTIIGCQDKTVSPKSQKTEIMPLAVGNFWEYKVTIYDDSLNKEGFFFDTIKVIGEEYVKSEKVYNILIGNMVTSYSNKLDGLYAIIYAPPYVDEKWLIYKYPGKPNEVYLSDFGIGTIDSISINISIKLGNFKCYKYTFSRSNERGDETKQIDYVSPDIGKIVEEIYFNVEGGEPHLELRKELIEYFLK